jgi:hypothetical protein
MDHGIRQRSIPVLRRSAKNSQPIAKPQMKFAHQLANAFGLSALAILSGCAGVGWESAGHWNATLRSVVRRDSIPPGTDRRCAPPQANLEDAKEPLVAIVTLRVWGAPYDMAFSPPTGFDAEPGASVTVDSMRCKLRQAAPAKS